MGCRQICVLRMPHRYLFAQLSGLLQTRRRFTDTLNYSVGCYNHIHNGSIALHYDQSRNRSPSLANNVNNRKARVAVLGAGVSGLAATKSCLEENLQVVCFEQAPVIGGTWFYTEKPLPSAGASVYKGLIMNVSKPSVQFSDFPMSDTIATFPTHQQYQEYLQAYARHFELNPHIKLNTKVQSVTPVTPGRADGGWRVTYAEPFSGGVSHTAEFDALLVCTGFNRRPRYPTEVCPEQLQASGVDVRHIHFVRSFDDLRRKNVLVIGNQNSAGDAAAFSAEFAKQVTLSIGDEGAYIVPRWHSNGIAWDTALSRFANALMPNWFQTYSMKKAANFIIDHKKYGLTSHITKERAPGYMHTIINDDLPPLIKEGKVTVKPQLMKICERNAHFSDGSVHGPVDVVLCATGFATDFKYIDCGFLQGDKRMDIALYKGVFPVDVQEPSIACIGADQVHQGVPPLLEIQSRWAASVFAEKCKLPSTEVRQQFWQHRKKLFRDQGHVKNTTWTLMDSVAEEMGIRPTFWRVLAKDPYLAFHFAFGHPLLHFYRLSKEKDPANAYESSEEVLNSNGFIR